MKTKKQEKDYNRENFARSSEEVPLFPMRPTSMSHPEMDELEKAQFDFVEQAGRPDSQT